MTKRRGFSIFETLIAVAMVAVVALVLLAAFGGGMRGLFAARGASTALALAQEKLEYYLVASQASLHSEKGHFNNRFARFEWQTEVTDVMPGLKRITVTVHAGAGESATVMTYHRASAGRIVFSQEAADESEQIWSCLPDGSDRQQLTHEACRNAQPALSPDGHTVAFASNRSGTMQIYLLDLRTLTVTPLTQQPLNAQSPAWSPDGSQLAYVANDGGFSQIFRTTPAGGDGINISRSQNHELAPCWSADGQRLCWVTDRFGGMDLVVASCDGTGATRLTPSGGWNTAPAWSPDGHHIAFLAMPNGHPEIYQTDVDDPTVATPLTSTKKPFNGDPSWSPDGRQLVFCSERDGVSNLYIMNHDGSGQHALLPTQTVASRGPCWIR